MYLFIYNISFHMYRHLFDATLFCSVLTHSVMFFRMIRFKILICFKMLNICYIVIKLYTFFEESKVICSHVGKTVKSSK